MLILFRRSPILNLHAYKVKNTFITIYTLNNNPISQCVWNNLSEDSLFFWTPPFQELILLWLVFCSQRVLEMKHWLPYLLRRLLSLSIGKKNILCHFEHVSDGKSLEELVDQPKPALEAWFKQDIYTGKFLLCVIHYF